MYNSLASLDFIGETNWCSLIRSFLFRTNYRDVWENHRVENANRLIKQVKLCLINTYKVDWSIKARNSIQLRAYIKFKFEHSLEEYLLYIPDTRCMNALSRLRMCSHMLEIERGRHVKPQKILLEQRICQRCTSNYVDDEIHFLITCSYFAGGGPRVVVSTAAFHVRVRGSVPGLGGLKETKNVSSPSTCESQYCGEPPWPRGSVLGLRPPGLEFRILCLEESVISIISPSSGGSPGPV